MYITLHDSINCLEFIKKEKKKGTNKLMGESAFKAIAS